MAIDGMTEGMRGFAAELQANPWYRRVYVVQVAVWFAGVAFYEAALAPDGPLLKHAIDGGATMSFLAYGSLASSVLMVDGAKTVYERGTELMGIVLRPARNRFVAQGEERGRAIGEAIGEARGEERGRAIGEERGKAIGEAIGEERGLEESSGWFARYMRAQEEGREFDEPPPWERNGRG